VFWKDREKLLVRDAEASGNRDQQRLVSNSRQAVESAHKRRTKRWSLAQVPKKFCVVPCCFSSSTYTPGGDQIFQMRNGWKRITQKADMQCSFGRFNDAVKRGIE
jgi:hypothetical protein